MVAAIAVASAFGDVIALDGALLGAPHGDRGELLRSAELIPQMPEPPHLSIRPGANTTLVCVCTDASLGCPRPAHRRAPAAAARRGATRRRRVAGR
jgi:hypothetical protein